MGRILPLAARLQNADRPIYQPLSQPSPITGWNTRDALDEMAPTDAVQLDNFFPDFGGCLLRNGFTTYASGMGSGAVQTLAEYRSGANDHLLAGCSGSIWNVQPHGVVTSLGSGFTQNAWQTQNFNGRMFFVNGSDTMQVWDGTTLTNGTFTGVALSTLIGVATYQGRLFFWQDNAQGFWYAGANAITGALSFFDLSMVAQLGGKLLAVTTFSHDGGNGVMDVICFVMSSGDALLYFGNDPSNANNWSLVGKYKLAPPVGPRAVSQYGADAYITTYDDHIPLQQQLVALKVGQLPTKSKIAPSVSQTINANPTAFGYQAIYYPAGRRLMFNMPNGDGTFYQHVFNTATQAWCRFTGMNAYCWSLYANGLYFGGAAGSVYQADTGAMDNGANIQGIGQQAWTLLNQTGPTRKRLSALRPIIQLNGTCAYTFKVGFDYKSLVPVINGSASISGSPWNTSPWNTSPWSSEINADTRWRVASGSGQAMSFLLTLSSGTGGKWLRSDYRVEAGIGF